MSEITHIIVFIFKYKIIMYDGTAKHTEKRKFK